jgi:hypothetical protein
MLGGAVCACGGGGYTGNDSRSGTPTHLHHRRPLLGSAVSDTPLDNTRRVVAPRDLHKLLKASGRVRGHHRATQHGYTTLTDERPQAHQTQADTYPHSTKPQHQHQCSQQLGGTTARTPPPTPPQHTSLTHTSPPTNICIPTPCPSSGPKTFGSSPVSREEGWPSTEASPTAAGKSRQQHKGATLSTVRFDAVGSAHRAAAASGTAGSPHLALLHLLAVHLGHFALAPLLLPWSAPDTQATRIRASAPSRTRTHVWVGGCREGGGERRASCPREAEQGSSPRAVRGQQLSSC